MQDQRRAQQAGNLALPQQEAESVNLPTRELRRIAALTDTLVRDLQQIAEARSVSLRLLAPSRARPNELALWQVAASGDRGEAPLCQEPDDGANWTAIRSGEPVYIPEWRRSDLPAKFRRDTRSSLTVPVYDSTSLIGTLNLESLRPADFLEHVTDAVDYATLAGRAYDLVRMTAWTQFVRSTALEYGELHVVANDLWAFRRIGSARLEHAELSKLEEIELAIRGLLTVADPSRVGSTSTTLRALLAVDDDWELVASDIYNYLIRAEVTAVLSLVILELLRNANSYTPYLGLKQVSAHRERFNGAEWVVLNVVNEPRADMDDDTVSELFRAVDAAGETNRVRVGTMQCGWLASLIGGRIDAWRLPTRELSVQLRLPPHCFRDGK